MHKHKQTLGFTLALILFSILNSQAQVVVTAVTNWKRDVDANDLTTSFEAGNDLKSTVETAPNFNQLDIRNVETTQQWKVAISRQDINWPAALTLSVIRNSVGTPCGGCMGVNVGGSPSVYVPITVIETDFIQGSGEVTGINLQYKIEGISLTIPADSYSTEILYTLYGD